VQSFFGENTNPVPASATSLVTGKSGDGTSYHVSYAAGPLSAGFGAQETKGTSVEGNAFTGVAAIPGKYEVATAYVRYDFGAALVTIATVTEKMVTAGSVTSANAAAVAGNLKNESRVLGLRVPMGAVTLNTNYTTSTYTSAANAESKGTQISLQAMYALSKRTDLYANYVNIKNKAGGTNYGIGNGSGRLVAAVANETATAYQIGVRHNF